MKYSRKDAASLTILMLQWIGESSDHNHYDWQKMYNNTEYVAPICYYTSCIDCPIQQCSMHINDLHSTKIIEKRKEKVAALVKKIRRHKWQS